MWKSSDDSWLPTSVTNDVLFFDDSNQNQFLKGQSFVLVFARFLFIKMINSKQRIIRTESENHLEGLSGVIFDSTVCTVLIFFTIKIISIINLSLTI